jgi:hypothetical protein
MHSFGRYKDKIRYESKGVIVTGRKMGRQFAVTDEHAWAELSEAERRDIGRALGGAGDAFDARPLAERVTLRALRLAMTRAHLGANLWREVRGVVWVSPNQAGLVVADPARFHVRALAATRPDGTPAFRPDPRWLVRLFKHGAEWSLRETGVVRWGLQLYRRGRSRGCEGEVVADLDAVALAAGSLAHMRDVLGPNADPLDAWRAITRRV